MTQMHLPRQLEEDGSAERIRRVLTARMKKIWAPGELAVPVVPLNGPLRKVLQDARFKHLLRCGFEEISEQLKKEQHGIQKVEGAEQRETERISRLVLVSNDGAQRLYRHIEQLLITHASRVMVCLLDVDSLVLGKAITGRERRMKVVLIEHKDLVSRALRAITAGETFPENDDADHARTV